MENEMTAYVPSHIRALLSPGKAGEVLLVTSSGVYLQFDAQIVLLCDAKWGVLPIGIGVTDFARAIRLLNPREGQQVAISDRLLFPAGSIPLAPSPLPSPMKCSHAPQLSLIKQAAEALAALKKEKGISLLVLPLVLGRETEAVLKINPYCAYAHPWLQQLRTAIPQGNEKSIRQGVEKLLGLGTGLTPSADDVFLGMLYIFRTLAEKAPPGAGMFQEAILQLCAQRTHPISAAYLKAMLAGAPFEKMEQLFKGLCGEEPLDITHLTQIGGSSGTEMLLGILIALQICGFDASKKEEFP